MYASTNKEVLYNWPFNKPLLVCNSVIHSHHLFRFNQYRVMWKFFDLLTETKRDRIIVVNHLERRV